MKDSATKISAAAQNRRILEQVVGIARSGQARVTVTGGSKPHVTITKQVAELDDVHLRPLLSGIEYATRSHFSIGRDSAGFTEWLLKSQHLFVTVRCTKSMG